MQLLAQSARVAKSTLSDAVLGAIRCVQLISPGRRRSLSDDEEAIRFAYVKEFVPASMFHHSVSQVYGLSIPHAFIGPSASIFAWNGYYIISAATIGDVINEENQNEKYHTEGRYEITTDGFVETSNDCVLKSASALRATPSKTEVDLKKKEAATLERKRNNATAAERREKFAYEMGLKAAHSWQARARMVGLRYKNWNHKLDLLTHALRFSERRRCVIVYTPVKHGIRRHWQIAASDY